MFFGNENSGIREIIFPALVLFRLPPALSLRRTVVLPCLPTHLVCYGHEFIGGEKSGSWAE